MSMNVSKSDPGMMDFVRIKTGIPGLDQMTEGGFPFPSTVLVAGSAGTGKTTFALQFLMQGAKEGEQCLYFTTLSEPVQWMLRFASRLGFINKNYFGKEVRYVELGTFLREEKDPQKLLEFIEEHITEVMPQRIVIDPVTVIEELIGGSYRNFLYDLANRLKNWQAVSILTGEVLPDEPYPVQVSYIVDTVILLSYGVKHVTALQTLLIAVLEPILNPIWVFLVLGERPGPWALVGGAIILVAVTLRSVLSLRSAVRSTSAG
jgi:circadian clock protein KaiC